MEFLPWAEAHGGGCATIGRLRAMCMMVPRREASLKPHEQDGTFRGTDVLDPRRKLCVHPRQAILVGRARATWRNDACSKAGQAGVALSTKPSY